MSGQTCRSSSTILPPLLPAACVCHVCPSFMAGCKLCIRGYVGSRLYLCAFAAFIQKSAADPSDCAHCAY
eukprot:10914386-Heterocapsa_arctica.AAC.1